MKTIKFLPDNKILLNNKILLTKINYTKKRTNWYTINGDNYAEV